MTSEKKIKGARHVRVDEPENTVEENANSNLNSEAAEAGVTAPLSLKDKGIEDEETGQIAVVDAADAADAADADDTLAGSAMADDAAEGDASDDDDDDDDDDDFEPVGKHSPAAIAANVESEDGEAEGLAPVMSPLQQELMSEAEKASRRRRALKITGIVFGVLILILGIAYGVGTYWFSTHFYPNTQMGKTDVSLWDADSAVQELDKNAKSYSITITCNDFKLKVSSDEMQYTLDSSKAVNQMLEAQESWKWPYEIFQTHDATSHVSGDFGIGLSEKVRAAVEEYNKTATDPVNATIGYNEKSKKFEIVPIKLGTKIDASAAITQVAEAITSGKSEVALTDDALLRPEVVDDDKRLVEACKLADEMVAADLVLTLDGEKVTEVDGSVISQWVEMGEDVKPVLNTESMNKWIQELSDSLNTVDTARTYTRADGKTYTVEGGSYGWDVDGEELAEVIRTAVANGEKTTFEIPCYQTAAKLVKRGEADWGDYYVDVDLTEQYARFYDGDAIIWEADFISGAADGQHETPQGVYQVNKKESPSKLVGEKNAAGVPEYETTVQYWMPFIRNEIGFHDATWQPDFGGEMYRYGYGSHGCINLSYTNAQILYGILDSGTPVVVHY